MSKIIKCPICGSENYRYDESIKKYVCCSCNEEFEFIDKPSKSKVQESVDIDDREKFFNKIIKKTVEIHAYFEDTIQSGTAFFISPNYLLTNTHVIVKDLRDDKNINNIAIQINGSNYDKSKRFEVELVSANYESDIAILRTDKISNDFVSFAENIYLGQKIYTTGNSRGQGLCVLDGIVSDVNRVVEGRPVFMTDALVTSGNSGGPIFNEKGFVLGMVTMSSSKSVAMNYAIPAKVLKDYITEIEDKEEITILK